MSLAKPGDTPTSYQLETPPRRSHWLEASCNTESEPQTQRTERPISTQSLMQRRSEQRTPRAPPLQSPSDTSEQSASRDRILTMAKIQSQLEAALEEERTKRFTRDAQVQELRKERDQLAAKCASLEAQLRVLSAFDSTIPVRPTTPVEEKLCRASQENKAIKAVLEDVCNSLQALKEENDRLRRLNGALPGVADADDSREGGWRPRSRLVEGEELFSPVARDLLVGGNNAESSSLQTASALDLVSQTPVAILDGGQVPSSPQAAQRTLGGEQAQQGRSAHSPPSAQSSARVSSSAQPMSRESLHTDLRMLEQEVRREGAERLRLAVELESARRAMLRVYEHIMQRDTQPIICGIGVRLATGSIKSKGVVRIEELVAGGPAAVCGAIKANDIILAVDDRAVAGLTFEEMHKLIGGPEGSRVRIKGRRNEQAAPYEVTLQRASAAKAASSAAAAPAEGETLASLADQACAGAQALQERVRTLQSDLDGLKVRLAEETERAQRCEDIGSELREAVSQLNSSLHAVQSEKAALEQHMRGRLEPEGPRAVHERERKLLAQAPVLAGVDEDLPTRPECEAVAPRTPVADRDWDARSEITMAVDAGSGQDLCGVGLRITETAPYRVVGCKQGGAADRTGEIREGDLVLAVDRVAVSGLPYSEVRKLILGRAGSQVEMKFERTRGKPFAVSMIRLPPEAKAAPRPGSTPSRPSSLKIDSTRPSSAGRVGGTGNGSGSPLYQEGDAQRSRNSSNMEDLQAVKSGLDEAVRALAERDVALKQSAALSTELEKTVSQMNSEIDSLRRDLQVARDSLREVRDAICEDIPEAKVDRKVVAGLGLRLAPVSGTKGAVRVEEVVGGGSASQGGVIKAHDLLLAVDGKAVAGLSLAQVNELIKGPAGSPVKIKGQHADKGGQYETVLNRKVSTAQTANVPSPNPSQLPEVAEACHAASSLRSDLKVAKDRLALLEEEALQRDSKLKELELALETAKAAQNSSDVRLQAAVARNADLASQNSQLEASNAELSASLHSLESEKAALEQRLRGQELEVLRARISTPEKPIRLPERSLEEDWDARSSYSSITDSSPDTCGVGLRLTETAPFRVKNCAPNGPAHKTGEIRADDVLLSVDGVSIAGRSFADVRKMILGPMGTVVEMQFLRARGDERRNFNVSMVRAASGPVDPGKEGGSRPNNTPRPGSQNLTRDESARSAATPRPGSQNLAGTEEEITRALVEKDARIKNLSALSNELEKAISDKNAENDQARKDLAEARKCIQMLYDAICQEISDRRKNVGVGLRLNLKEIGKGIAHVDEIVAGGPAALNGVVRPKDTIISINGTKMQGLAGSQANDLLQGPVGTLVHIVGQHEDKGPLYEVWLTRLPLDSEKNSFPVEFVLDKQPDEVGDMDKFATEILLDIARVTGLRPTRLRVTSIMSGSVLVNILISEEDSLDSARAMNSLSKLAQDLEKQLKEPTSVLMKGKETRLTKSIAPSPSRTGPCLWSGAAVVDGKVKGHAESRFWKSRTIQACVFAALARDSPHPSQSVNNEANGSPTCDGAPKDYNTALARIEELEAALKLLKSASTFDASDKLMAQGMPDKSDLADLRKELDQLRTENQEMARRLSKRDEEDWESKSTFSTYSGESESSLGPDNCGVGLRVTDFAPFKVRGCFAGGPAHRSGEIRPGDVLLSVDGVAVSQLPIQELRKKIVGRAGSKVEMKFQRSKGDEQRTFAVTMIRSSNEVFAKSISQPLSREVGVAEELRKNKIRLEEMSRSLVEKDAALERLKNASTDNGNVLSERRVQKETLEKELQDSDKALQIVHAAIISSRPASIGVKLASDAVQGIIIEEIHASGSASTSGIVKAKDVLLAVNGSSVSGLTMEQVQDLISGEEGTNVKIRARHCHGGEEYELLLTREFLAHSILSSAQRDVLVSESRKAAAALHAELKAAQKVGLSRATNDVLPHVVEIDARDAVQLKLDAANKALDSLRSENEELARRLARQAKEEDDWETKSAYSTFSGESEAVSGAGADACGVGLRITDAAPFRVRGCVAGGAAHKTGEIRPGDTLLAVDGVAVAALPIAQVRKLIVGKAGSRVEMQFQRTRGDERRSFAVSMVRAPADGKPASRPSSVDLSRGGGKESKDAAVAEEVRDLRLKLDGAKRALDEKDAEIKKQMSSLTEAERNISEILASREKTVRSLEEARQAVHFLHSAICDGAARSCSCGVGILLALLGAGKGPWHVEQIISGGPAATNGTIKLKDVILSVDGKPLAGLTLEQVQELIDGPEGTSVLIKGQHGERGAPYEVKLNRELAARQSPRGRSPRADTRSFHALTAEGCATAAAMYSEVRGLKLRLQSLAEDMVRRDGELRALQLSLDEARVALSNAERAGCGNEQEDVKSQLVAAQRDLETLRAENQELARRLARQAKEDDDWDAKSTLSGESEAVSGAGADACGVGLRITDAAPFRVRGCVAGGAAHKTGEIRPGDTLLAVDGVAVAALPIAQVRKLIVGKAGSRVEMQFQRTRGDERRSFAVSMVRAPADGKPASRPSSVDLSRGGGKESKDAAVAEEVRDLRSKLEEASRALSERDAAAKKLVSSSAEAERAAADVGAAREKLIAELEEARQQIQSLHDAICKGGVHSSCGLGLMLAAPAGGKGKGFRVERVVSGGSAAANGKIQVKDTVTAVDGREIAGLTLEQVHDLIDGPEGTSVTLRCLHGDGGSQYEVALVREFLGRQNPRAVTRADSKVWQALAAEGREAAAALHAEVKELKGRLMDEVRRREDELQTLRRRLEEAQGSLARAEQAGGPASADGNGQEVADIKGQLEAARRELDALRAENQEMGKRLARQAKEEEDWETKSAHSAMSGESEFSMASGPDACGVGLRITDAAPFRVRGCVPGGPADGSGQIRIGDVLMTVDGTAVGSLPIAEVRRLIVGAPGSRVAMQFLRNRGDERRTFEVAMVRAPAVAAGRVGQRR